MIKKNFSFAAFALFLGIQGLLVSCSNSSTDYDMNVILGYLNSGSSSPVVDDKSSIKPTNLGIYYEFETKKVTISWADSPSSKLNHLKVFYTVGDGSEESTVVARGVQHYLIDAEIATGVSVKAKVVAYDASSEVGATSEASDEISVITQLGATELRIPPAGTDASGNKIDAILTGNHFSEQKTLTTVTGTIVTGNLEMDKFTVSCNDVPFADDEASVSFVNHNRLKVSFKIPDAIGDYTIKVSYNGAYGTFDQSGNLSVKDYSAIHEGDLILSDRTTVSYSEVISYTDAQKDSAVSIIYAKNEYGVPLGVGLHNSKSGKKSGYYSWALEGSSIENIKFEDLICTPSTGSAALSSQTTFSGDTYGNNNWEDICCVNPKESVNAKIYYPAFYYAENYGDNFEITSAYKDGWYIPTISELAALYNKLSMVDTILKALGATELGSSSYWSSSQSDAKGFSAWNLNFNSGRASSVKKGNKFYVCVIRAFN